jgi:predicted ABC-type ATPase
MQSSNTSSKRILILAGPNGAGKTTFAKEFLPNEANCLTFINADLIAAGLSPFEPEKSAIQAGKLMLRTIDRQIREKKSFA